VFLICHEVLAREAVGHGLRLDGGENDVAAVRDDDRSGPAAIGGVDQDPLVARLLDDPLDRRGVGADDGDDAVRRDDVAESDVDETRIHRRSAPYSTFWICSRRLSSSPLTAIIAVEISRSFALLPMVLASRPSSCTRNSSVRPTAPVPLRCCCICARWLRKRVISSEMSLRSAKNATSAASRPSSTWAAPRSSSIRRASLAALSFTTSGALRSTSSMRCPSR